MHARCQRALRDERRRYLPSASRLANIAPRLSSDVSMLLLKMAAMLAATWLITPNSSREMTAEQEQDATTS